MSVQASAALAVESLKEHVATLTSELQGKDAEARAAQQTVLEQLAKERTGFRESLKGLQSQLHAARTETVRAGRLHMRLVSKVRAAAV